MASNIVDFIGAKSVAMLMTQSGLSKFIIRKWGAPVGTIPVFESLDNKNSGGAVASFEQWANLVLLGNPENDTIYDIQLFNEADYDEEKEPGEVLRKGWKKRDKIRFNFMLTPTAAKTGRDNPGQPSQAIQSPVAPAQPSYSSQDISFLIETAITKHLEREEREELEDRLDAIEEALMKLAGGDMDEEQQQKPDKFDRVFDMLEKRMFQKSLKDVKETKYVNGTGTATQPKKSTYNPNHPSRFSQAKVRDEFKAKQMSENLNPERSKQQTTDTENRSKIVEELNNSIKTLFKHDKQLHVHLAKLAELAEANPEKFKGFIQILDTL